MDGPLDLRLSQLEAVHAKAVHLLLLAHDDTTKRHIGEVLFRLHEATACLEMVDDEQRLQAVEVVDATIGSLTQRLSEIAALLVTDGPYARFVVGRPA